jgi:hypothetical protein
MRVSQESRRPYNRPDLATQYEQLLDAVWRCEREARMDDKIALANRVEQLRIEPFGHERPG